MATQALLSTTSNRLLVRCVKGGVLAALRDWLKAATSGNNSRWMGQLLQVRPPFSCVFALLPRLVLALSELHLVALELSPLQILLRLPVDLAALKASKIGVVVAKLSSRTNAAGIGGLDRGVVSRADELYDAWAKAATAHRAAAAESDGGASSSQTKRRPGAGDAELPSSDAAAMPAPPDAKRARTAAVAAERHASAPATAAPSSASGVAVNNGATGEDGADAAGSAQALRLHPPLPSVPRAAAHCPWPCMRCCCC